MIDTLDLVSRMGIATIAGAVVGYERESQGQLAGMRTHALVAIGACLFTLIGAYGFPDVSRSGNVDPMRVAAQVVSGIGFIGAGAILRDGGAIRGVTTAAALWASAALGVAAAAGLFDATIVGLVAILFALIGLRSMRRHVLRNIMHTHQSVSMTYERGHGTLAPLVTAIEDGGGQIQNLRIDDDSSLRHVELDVRIRDADKLRERLSHVAELPEVDAVTCR